MKFNKIVGIMGLVLYIPMILSQNNNFSHLTIQNESTKPIIVDIMYSQKDNLGTFGFLVPAHQSSQLIYPQVYYWFEKEGKGFGTGTTASDVLMRHSADQIVIHVPDQTSVTQEFSSQVDSQTLIFDGTRLQHTPAGIATSHQAIDPALLSSRPTSALQTIKRGGTPTPLTPRAGMPIQPQVQR